MKFNPGSVAVMVGTLVAGASMGCTSHMPPLQTAECMSDEACRGVTRVCERGRCEQCRQNSDCGSGLTCVSSRCEQAPVAVVTPPTAVAVAVVGSDGNRNCFQSVYFSFDDSLLGDATRASLQQVADCLRHQTASHYVLMGHADPRGSTEYNLALGERRARSVENYLVSLGVDGRRLAESSDGSEDAMGTNEASWAHDRRADSHSTSTNNTTATMP